jgi:ferredoxin
VLDELGFNVTPAGEVPAELVDQARRGALSCPESAITVED